MFVKSFKGVDKSVFIRRSVRVEFVELDSFFVEFSLEIGSNILNTFLNNHILMNDFFVRGNLRSKRILKKC